MGGGGGEKVFKFFAHRFLIVSLAPKFEHNHLKEIKNIKYNNGHEIYIWENFKSIEIS